MGRVYGLMLEEVDEILDAWPKLVSLDFLGIYITETNNQRHLEIQENSPVALLDKISLFKPKTGLRKLAYSGVLYGCDETLTYIMRVLPNLETLRFYPFFKSGRGPSKHVLTSFILERKAFEVGHLFCKDFISIIPLFWQSEEYKSNNKKSYP